MRWFRSPNEKWKKSNLPPEVLVAIRIGENFHGILDLSVVTSDVES